MPSTPDTVESKVQKNEKYWSLCKIIHVFHLEKTVNETSKLPKKLQVWNTLE